MATYLVTTPDGKERLVEAANQAGARNHVSRDSIQVKVASPADLFRIAKAGGDIEQAGESPAAQPEPPAEGGDGDKPPVTGGPLGEPSEGGPQEVKTPKAK
jgi:hypothetical protein